MRKRHAVFVAFLLAADQVLKLFSFFLPPRGAGGGFFLHTLNPGIAFSLPVGRRMLFILLATGFVFLFFFLKKELASSAPRLIPFALIFGGAVSNIIDRLRVGAVVDYLAFPILGFHFNIADAMVVAGVILIARDEMASHRSKKAEGKSSS